MFLKNTELTKVSAFLTAASLLVFPFIVSAQIVGLTDRPLTEIIADIIDWLLKITSGVAILFIIIGGIIYATAAGDDKRMETAKSIITYAVLGLLFILISYSIVVTVNGIINP